MKRAIKKVDRSKALKRPLKDLRPRKERQIVAGVRDPQTGMPTGQR